MIRSLVARASRTLPFALSAGAALMLAACGGSGSSISAATTTITGTTTAGATVTLGTETGGSATTAGTDGSYSFVINTDQLNTTTAVTVTVSKAGFETCTATLTGLSSAGGTATVSGCPSLAVLAAGAYAPAEGVVLTRLGDGIARAGETNSKLTLSAASGVTKTIELGSPSGLTLSDYTKFTVTVNIRGLEASNCADKITVFQATSAGATPTVSKLFQADTTFSLADSDALGAFTSYELELPLNANAITTTGGSMFVKLDSGACRTGGDAADDFEFVNVTAKFS